MKIDASYYESEDSIFTNKSIQNSKQPSHTFKFLSLKDESDNNFISGMFQSNKSEIDDSKVKGCMKTKTNFQSIQISNF